MGIGGDGSNLITDVGGLIPNVAGDMPAGTTMDRAPADPGIEIGMRNGCIIPGCPGVPFIPELVGKYILSFNLLS